MQHSFEEIRAVVRSMLGQGTTDGTEQAAEAIRQYLHHCPSARDRGMAMGLLGETLCMQGDTGLADALFRQARPLVVHPGDAIHVLCGHALLVTRLQSYVQARPLADDLHSLLTRFSLETLAVAPWGYAWLAHLLLLLRDAQGALDAAAAAVQAAGQLPGQPGMAEAIKATAAAQEAAGLHAAARKSWAEAMLVMTSPHCLMDARAEHARLSILLGDLPAAANSLARAVEFPDLRDRQVLTKVLTTIADLCDRDPVSAARLVRSLGAHLAHVSGEEVVGCVSGDG